MSPKSATERSTGSARRRKSLGQVRIVPKAGWVDRTYETQAKRAVDEAVETALAPFAAAPPSQLVGRFLDAVRAPGGENREIEIARGLGLRTDPCPVGAPVELLHEGPDPDGGRRGTRLLRAMRGVDDRLRTETGLTVTGIRLGWRALPSSDWVPTRVVAEGAAVAGSPTAGGGMTVSALEGTWRQTYEEARTGREAVEAALEDLRGPYASALEGTRGEWIELDAWISSKEPDDVETFRAWVDDEGGIGEPTDVPDIGER